MDELHADLYGFDFRGPSSSESLNDFLEKANLDMGTLIQTCYSLRNETTLISGQTLKQTLAMARKFSALSDRDSGSNCKADLSDPTVLLTTDKDGATIDASSRLTHRQEYGCIVPSTESVNWLAKTFGERKLVSEGVTSSFEAVNETGTVYSVPLELAYSGLNSIFYERTLKHSSVAATTQETSFFFGIPISRTGIGYPNSNYISFIPFPLYTTNLRVWYTLDSEPTLTVSGSVWHDWSTYNDTLYHNEVFGTQSGPLYASFQTAPITAIRIDIQQPFYLLEDNYYIYSYGLGLLEIGLTKPLSSTCKGTVKITKPSGSFAGIETTSGNVVLDNIASADVSSVLSTYTWVDPEDAGIAYVEITLTPNAITSGQLPVIKEVSVDYISA